MLLMPNVLETNDKEKKGRDREQGKNETEFLDMVLQGEDEVDLV